MDYETLTTEMLAGRSAEPFGVWTDHHIPEDRSGWHPLVRRFYEHWLSIAPPGLLPGRQHIKPEGMVPMLSRLWMMDVHRDPLRFCYRLCGTSLVRSLNREVTGQWLDEIEPETVYNPIVRDRYRFVAGLAVILGGEARLFGTVTLCIGPSKIVLRPSPPMGRPSM